MTDFPSENFLFTKISIFKQRGHFVIMPLLKKLRNIFLKRNEKQAAYLTYGLLCYDLRTSGEGRDPERGDDFDTLILLFLMSW